MWRGDGGYADARVRPSRSGGRVWGCGDDPRGVDGAPGRGAHQSGCEYRVLGGAAVSWGGGGAVCGGPVLWSGCGGGGVGVGARTAWRDGRDGADDCGAAGVRDGAWDDGDTW